MSISAEDRGYLAEAAKDLISDHAQIDRTQAVVETDLGWDRSLWQRFSEAGWLGLLVPESHGGSGVELADMAVILEQLGRHAVPSPFLSSAVVSTWLLAQCSNERAGEVLAELAEGRKIATVALTGASGLRSSVDIEAIGAGDGWLLSGTAGFVLDAQDADVIIVSAKTAAGEPILAMINADSEGLTLAPILLMDRTRRAAHVGLADVRVSPEVILAIGDTADALIDGAILVALAGLAADSAGGASASVSLAVQYAKQRVQFDRVIGSFQAVKHRLADMYVLSEATIAAAHAASAELDLGSQASRRLVLGATSFAADAYVRVAGDAVQVHGGIGFTWEYHCHLYLKRALFAEAYLYDGAAQRKDLIDTVARSVAV